MDRLHVRLTTVGVAALIAVSAIVFGLRAPRRDTTASAPAATPAAALDGASLFDRHCAGCHSASDVARGLRAAPDPAAARKELGRFLESHGSAAADEDRAIVDFLARPPR